LFFKDFSNGVLGTVVAHRYGDLATRRTMLLQNHPTFEIRLSDIKRVDAVVAPPYQRNTVNLNHCSRFVFLFRAID